MSCLDLHAWIDFATVDSVRLVVKTSGLTSHNSRMYLRGITWLGGLEEQASDMYIGHSTTKLTEETGNV